MLLLNTHYIYIENYEVVTNNDFNVSKKVDSKLAKELTVIR